MRRIRVLGRIGPVVLALACVRPLHAAATHGANEPTWTYQGVVATSTAQMKHIDVLYDPAGLAGVPGNPRFLMVWGTSSPNQLYVKTSDDGLNRSAHSQAAVSFPSTTVPLYHPEVIYDRAGFADKKSVGDVHFKMWFYDAGYEGGGSYNWIRYAESADGLSWQIYEDSPHSASAGKNYLEFSGGSGNEMSVLYRRGGTGIVVSGVDQQYVGYQGVGLVGVSGDGAWFGTVSGQGGGPTDVCREMLIAGPGDVVEYRAWDDLPGAANRTSWESSTGLTWASPLAGDVPISGASWSDLYGAMSVVVVGGEYWMYDALAGDPYSVAVLTAPIAAGEVIPEPATAAILAAGGLGALVRRRRRGC